MKHAWPSFKHRLMPGGFSFWQGQVCPYQRTYEIGVWWVAASPLKPWVFLIDPELTPRDGGTFEEIPHLLFCDENPKLSGLCLFDPDGNEWSNKQLIADTTLPWALEWLQHYEFWHFDGVWRGKSVGPESVAEIRATTVHGPQSTLSKSAS